MLGMGTREVAPTNRGKALSASEEVSGCQIAGHEGIDCLAQVDGLQPVGKLLLRVVLAIPQPKAGTAGPEECTEVIKTKSSRNP